MYCAKCWTSNPDDALFCSNCGTPFPKVDSSTFAPGTQPQPVVQPAPQPVAPPPTGHSHSSYQSQQAPPTYTTPQPQVEPVRNQQSPPPIQQNTTASTNSASNSRPDNSFFVTMWILALIMGLIALYVLFNTHSNAESAPQQAAGAAFAVGLAVIPYCIVRAIVEMRNLQQP